MLQFGGVYVGEFLEEARAVKSAVAIKVQLGNEVSLEGLEDFVQEAKVLSVVGKHENCIELCGVALTADSGVALALQYAEGGVLSKRVGALSFLEAQRILTGIANGKSARSGAKECVVVLTWRPLHGRSASLARVRNCALRFEARQCASQRGGRAADC